MTMLRSRPRRASRLATATLVFSALVSFGGEPSIATAGDVVVSNGTVQLGIHPEAHLNVPGGPSTQGTTTVGVRYVPTNNEATGAGCACEGWGVADASSGLTGYANVSTDGVVNITPVSFVTTASTAVSVVTIGGVLEVTHDYRPSLLTPNLYEVVISIRNIGAVAVGDLRYRRVMDWDIEPTPYAEYVTVQTGTATNLLDANNDGFATANPLGSDTSGGVTLVSGNFTDAGPADHGARMDFGFGPLAVGATRTFQLYFGGAGTEASALAAISTVSAEVYSFGQPSTPTGPTNGDPNTFIFAFGGVGGAPIAPCAAEPTPGPGDIVGTSGPDQLSGTSGPDRIFGLGGNDKITGLAGDDLIFGGPGDDSITGSTGSDVLCGGTGRDYLAGSTGDDRLFGGDDNDDLAGGDGNDALSGESGDDRLAGGAGTNTNSGGAGTNTCVSPSPCAP